MLAEEEQAAVEFEVLTHTMKFPIPPMQMDFERSHPEKEEFKFDHESHIQWKLPIFIRVEVWPHESNTECFLIATEKKRGWDVGGRDGLTVTASVDRDCFDFRTEVFNKFPARERHATARLTQGAWNELALAISEHRSTYWINGQRIATCNFQGGETSATPCIGVYAFTTTFRARRFDASRDPALLAPLLRQIVTLCGTWSPGSGELAGVTCTNMSGAEILSVDARGDLRLKDLRVLLAEAMADRFGILPSDVLHGLALLLPSGRQLSSSDDAQLLAELLCS